MAASQDLTDAPDAPDGAVARRRGRPRAEDRDATILEAAKNLLEELGYDRLRIQDVADRAHVGLATIYRRWPTKQALVIAAMQHDKVEAALSETGDPRADLEARLHKLLSELTGPKCYAVAGFLTALRTDAELRDSFRATLLDDLREQLRGPIVQIIGADDPELELRVDLAPALLIFRMLVGDEPTDPDDTVQQICRLALGA